MQQETIRPSVEWLQTLTPTQREAMREWLSKCVHDGYTEAQIETILCAIYKRHSGGTADKRYDNSILN